MAIPHALPGQPVDLRPTADAPSEARTIALAKNEAFEAIRLMIPGGHEVARHQVAGMITFQCLEGRIAFTARGDTRELRAGHWLFLESNEPHSLVGLEDSTALLTIVFPANTPRPG